MAEWHPQLSAEEGPAGVWTMLDPLGKPYGRVEIRRAGERVFYRSWFGDTELIQTPTLRAATRLVYTAWMATLSPGPPPGGIYPNLKGIVGSGHDAAS